MLKVHAIGEYGIDELYGTAYIRVLYPLQVLANDGKIALTSGKTYEDYKDADIFFMQRFWKCGVSETDAWSFICFVRNNKKKYIYEIDDDLLDLVQIVPHLKAVVRIFLRYADGVIVSTPYLKQRLQGLNPNITVIPNFLSERMVGEENRPLPRKRTGIRLAYFGTRSHQQDFNMIKLPLIRVLNRHPEAHLVLVGALDDDAKLSEFPNTEVVDITPFSQYNCFWDWMRQNAAWDIGLAPLKQDSFTTCKSDIKYLDYAGAGVPGIFSNHPAYWHTVQNGVTGLLCDNTADAWEAALEVLISDAAKREKIMQNARLDLYANRILEKNAWRWQHAIENVMQEVALRDEPIDSLQLPKSVQELELSQQATKKTKIGKQALSDTTSQSVVDELTRPVFDLMVEQDAPARINLVLEDNTWPVLRTEDKQALAWAAHYAIQQDLPLRIITRGMPANPCQVEQLFEKIGRPCEVTYYHGARDDTAGQKNYRLSMGSKEIFAANSWSGIQSVRKSRLKGKIYLLQTTPQQEMRLPTNIELVPIGEEIVNVLSD